MTFLGDRMKIGLIDVDGHNFPNLPLMKLSAWHKMRGDSVDSVAWYSPMLMGHRDIVYVSKVFSDSPDYPYHIDADEIIKGGTGYAITTENGVERYDCTKDKPLDQEIEHIMPDYSLYETDTAYGFLSRGCPRGCAFCHVKAKEGGRAYKVADLREFWDGQKEICLCDPNILACSDWKDLLDQLAKSGASVDFNQGLDIRLMTDEKAAALARVKTKRIHFAFDRYEDAGIILPRLEAFKAHTSIQARKITVYILCGFDTTIEQDLERVYKVRELGFSPYVMIYDRQRRGRDDPLRILANWVNNRIVFWSCDRFENYRRGNR